MYGFDTIEIVKTQPYLNFTQLNSTQLKATLIN